jgi:hypothetical protein
MKGTITKVQIGSLTIEGVLADDKQFYVSVNQLNEITGFQYIQKYTIKRPQTLTGSGFQYIQNYSSQQRATAIRLGKK